MSVAYGGVREVVEEMNSTEEISMRDYQENERPQILGIEAVASGVNLANGCQQIGMMASDQCEAKSEVKRITMQLNGNVAEALRCLFFHGPTWDGNVPSKSGRDELVLLGLAARHNGWQWLTRAGIDVCFANGIPDEKDRHEARERKRRAALEDAAAQILGRV